MILVIVLWAGVVAVVAVSMTMPCLKRWTSGQARSNGQCPDMVAERPACYRPQGTWFLVLVQAGWRHTIRPRGRYCGPPESVTLQTDRLHIYSTAGSTSSRLQMAVCGRSL